MYFDLIVEDIESEQEIDWLADYPKVQYVYKISEVAFLVHKLKQNVKQFRSMKDEERLKKWKRREAHLAEISERVERALRIFHYIQGDKEKETKTKVKKRKLLDVFSEQARVAADLNKNSFRELRAKRIALNEELSEVCREEIANVKQLLTKFKIDFDKMFRLKKTYALA